MPPSPCQLTLIVPAYNESASIVATLVAIRAFLSKKPWTWEVIVSADGTDGTRERAAEFAKGDDRFIVMGQDARLGKGRGVRQGVLRAKGKIVGFLDADYKTPIEDLEKILPAFETGIDVAIGSRRLGAARIEKPQPLYRRIGSRVFNLLIRTLMGLPDVRDTQCGFKFFTASAAAQLFSLQRIDGYMFDVEILRLCKLLNLRVKEVGVNWRDDGDSRYQPVRGTIRNLKELLRIRRLNYDLPAAGLEKPQSPSPDQPRIAA
ncbi:MAG TPA: dolichyl-phosphate beta-glucosyltransferase [Tepidisphaeraceae bacterium]|jgi:dolichyl-phosphate beta-glucosyltransferase|nr:dolichyl-phosphate beta-glucosyltransferase [Tepidisphaeraceae bacterium]